MKAIVLKACQPNKKSKKISSKDFYHTTRWLNGTYFLFGILPIWRNTEGNIQFSFYNWRMIYSLTVYCSFIIFFTKCVVTERLHEVMKSLNDFDNLIYNIMFLSFGKAQYLFPIVGWLAALKISNYNNTWIYFEMKYKKTYGYSLKTDSLENKSFWLVIWSMFSILSLIFGQLFTLPTYNIVECFGFVYSSSAFFLYLALMHLHFAAIRLVANDLTYKLRSCLKTDVLTRDTIYLHRKLWIYLNSITQQFGEAFGNFSAIIILSSFIDLVISGYGYVTFVLKRINSKNTDIILPADEIGLIIASVVSGFAIIYPCNMAYEARQKVETRFVDILSMATTKSYHPSVINELLIYLDVIKDNPSVITLGGYVTLDRKLITKLFCTIVTYLVILMQFKIGFDQIKSNVIQ